jgi:elongation factor P
VSVWNDQVIAVDLPNQYVYTVVETPPNFKGNTVQGLLKPATLDCGAVVQVPMFIVEGEKILVDTTERRYMSRAKDTDMK